MSRESKIDQGHGKPSNFRGLVLTGWSRYDHFAVLCELLPVALPSLILNLEVISLNTSSEIAKFKQAEKLLKCQSSKEHLPILYLVQQDIKKSIPEKGKSLFGLSKFCASNSFSFIEF